jgi:hypothetical protein
VENELLDEQLRINQVNVNFADLRAAHRSARRQASLRRVLSKHAFGGPLDQAVRWHLFYEGQGVISVVAQGTGTTLGWSQGPAMEAADLGKADRLQALIKELSHGLKLSMADQTSLGVVLHLADEIDVGIVQEAFENPELFEQARAQVRETPSEVVTDLSTDQDPAIQWRYYPLLSGQRAVVLRHRVEFFTALQSFSDLDIKVAVHSAPIEMLALYLKLYAEAIEEKPHCFVFFYDRFTMVVPANQGVLDIKVLPHRQQDVPPAFGDDLFSLLERFGLVDSCVLLLVQCGTQDPTRLFSELDAFARRNHKNADGIEIQIPDQETIWGVFDESKPGQVKPEIIQRPEFLTEYNEKSGKEFPLSLGIKSDAYRFAILSRETFWPDDQKSRDKRLPRTIALTMTALLAARILGILCLLALGGWLALSVVGESHGDPLRLLPEMVNSKQAELNQLRETKQYLSLWDKILIPRSQASSAMDFFLALVPEGHEVVCDRLKYGIRQTDAKAGNAGGFSREWSIDGSCTDQGRDHLERLREGSTISSIFASTAARLTDPSFLTSDTRILKVVLREETNPQFGTDNKTGVLPYQFRLVVTQTFASSDPMAMPVLPKPKANKAAS